MHKKCLSNWRCGESLCAAYIEFINMANTQIDMFDISIQRKFGDGFETLENKIFLIKQQQA